MPLTVVVYVQVTELMILIHQTSTGSSVGEEPYMLSIWPVNSLCHHLCLAVSDEKEKYDPVAFRDVILQGINEAGTDLEQVDTVQTWCIEHNM